MAFDLVYLIIQNMGLTNSKLNFLEIKALDFRILKYSRMKMKIILINVTSNIITDDDFYLFTGYFFIKSY